MLSIFQVDTVWGFLHLTAVERRPNLTQGRVSQEGGECELIHPVRRGIPNALKCDREESGEIRVQTDALQT